MASRKQCIRALDLHENRLGNHKNVVGTGVVKIADQESGESDAVAVYVSKKVAEADLAPQDIIPRFLEIPGRGEAAVKIRTKVIEQGEVTLESPERL